MYTNADCTLYLYSKVGKVEKYMRLEVEGVFWDDVEQSTFLKTGQRDAGSVLLVIPYDSLDEPIEFTPGKDLAVKGIVGNMIDCSSQEAMAKSLTALRAVHSYVTVTMVDEKLFGSESMWHYELSCK